MYGFADLVCGSGVYIYIYIYCIYIYIYTEHAYKPSQKVNFISKVLYTI